MRVITTLKILCIVLFCNLFISCSENDEGTGIPEVEITEDALIGDWDVTAIDIYNGIKSATLNGQEIEYKYVMEAEGNDLRDYSISFVSDQKVSEAGEFGVKQVLATLDGDRFYGEGTENNSALRYDQLFFDSLLNVIDIQWSIEDKDKIRISGTTGTGETVSVLTNVLFFSGDVLRVTYELTDQSPFFGSDILTESIQIPAPTEDDPDNTMTLMGNNVSPSGSIMITQFTRQ